jgi:hypothetical protein
LFISGIAAEPEQGEDQREAQGYLCDGWGLNEWFWGSAPGTNPSSPLMREARSRLNLAAERLGSEVSV